MDFVVSDKISDNSASLWIPKVHADSAIKLITESLYKKTEETYKL